MRARRFIGSVLRSFPHFFSDGGIMIAGSLSYFLVMTIVPFSLLLVTLFGYFLGENQEFLNFLTTKIANSFPAAAPAITIELKKLIVYREIGLLSLGLYAILSYQLFSSLESSMNMIFRTTQKRPALLSILYSLFIMSIILILVIASFAASLMVIMFGAVSESSLELRISFVLRYAIPFLLMFLAATVIYRFLPKAKIRTGKAAAGAIFAAVLLETAKHVFTFYVVKVVKFGTVYGSLSAFIIVLLWMYYSSCILLIGAEVVKNLEAATAIRNKRVPPET